MAIAEPELRSPFLSGTSFGERAEPEMPAASAALESPFLSSFGSAAHEQQQADALQQLLAELEDENFNEAIDHLQNEAAGRYLAAQAEWSASEAGPGLAVGELERWIEPLSTEVDRLVDTVNERLAGTDLSTLSEGELESVFESMRPEAGLLPETFEQFLGGFFNTLKNVASKVVSGSLNVLGRIVPLSWLWDQLAKLAKTILAKVIKFAADRLPESVRPLAKQLAAKLFGSSEAATEAGWSGEDGGLAHEFNLQVAHLLAAPSEAHAETVVAEAVNEASQDGRELVSELDDARARLAQRLAQLPPGESPVSELEQFIPAVMAVMPAIRFGLKALGGRAAIAKFIASKIAGLAAPLIGDAAAKAVSGPVADLGLSLVGLEAPVGSEATLGAEALASTIEDTVHEVLELPAEAFEDPLRMEAEIQQAFAEAAARHVPTDFLRRDLPERETAGEGGIWILMPRATRPRYRYKKYTRIYLVPISRQAARAIRTLDGGTLEAHLLDRGVEVWPARAEVHLYETLPGGQPGHIAQFEGADRASYGETLGELQPLSTETASLLLHEAGLGRSGRFYRVALPGQVGPGMARPRHRFSVEVDLTHRTPHLRAHLRLSEREGQQLLKHLSQHALPAALSWLKHRYHASAAAVFAARLLRHAQPLLGKQLSQPAADRLGAEMTELMTHALSRFLGAGRHQELAAAVRDPKQGVTITFSFSLGHGQPLAEPHITVHAGWHLHHKHLMAPPAQPQPQWRRPAITVPAGSCSRV
jgi:hypothetical protein